MNLVCHEMFDHWNCDTVLQPYSQIGSVNTHPCFLLFQEITSNYYVVLQLINNSKINFPNKIADPNGSTIHSPRICNGVSSAFTSLFTVLGRISNPNRFATSYRITV